MKNPFEAPEINVIQFKTEDAQMLDLSSLLPEEGMENGGTGSGGSTGY